MTLIPLIFKPLFYTIPLEQWIPDKLHIMLRIWDRLCQFWQEQGTNVWNHTSLMGDDKLKVLRNFDLYQILPSSRAKKIRELWDRFNQIYLILKIKDYDPQQLFLSSDKIDKIISSKGLYIPSAVTCTCMCLSITCKSLWRDTSVGV